MAEVLFEVTNVSKQYKKGKSLANENISFQIYEGEILGLLGPNGAGKSTLIKQLVAHLKPTNGEIKYRGENVLKQTKQIARNLAYYSQEPNSMSSLTVREANYFTGRLRGLKKEVAKEETSELLKELELEEVADKLLKNISGGQKRLTGIGTTLIGKANVYIFDEPTNELDPKKRRLVWDIIQKRNKGGATVILVTHNILEAEQVVDRVAVINHGQLLAIDHVGRLKENVDQRLKCEVTAREVSDTQLENKLKTWGQVTVVSDQRFRLLISKSEAASFLTFLNESCNEAVMNYSILPPSLEDVYFHIDQEQEEGGNKSEVS